MKDEFTFELSTPISYQQGADGDSQGTTLVITAPSMKYAKYSLKLQQLYERSTKDFQMEIYDLKNLDVLLKMNENATPLLTNENANLKTVTQDGQEVETEEIKTEDILQKIFQSKIDVDSFFSELKNILTKSHCCKIDDVQLLNELLYEKISLTDMKKILCEYIKNFLSI